MYKMSFNSIFHISIDKVFTLCYCIFHSFLIFFIYIESVQKKSIFLIHVKVIVQFISFFCIVYIFILNVCNENSLLWFMKEYAYKC